MSPTLESLAAELAEVKSLISGPRVTSTILTRREAIIYVKCKSARAFARWLKEWGVRSRSYDRYSSDELDLALAREAGVVRVPASLRRKTS